MNIVIVKPMGKNLFCAVELPERSYLDIGDKVVYQLYDGRECFGTAAAPEFDTNDVATVTSMFGKPLKAVARLRRIEYEWPDRTMEEVPEIE